MQRRLGRFFVSGHMIRQHPEIVKKAVSRTLPVSVQYHFDRDAYEYLAMSNDFAEIPLGQVAPEYVVNITQIELPVMHLIDFVPAVR